MQMYEIEEQMAYVLSAALKKCGDWEDAKDLTQEVLLAALKQARDGKQVENVRAWLSAVLNNKYYDFLRKKYKLPMVSVNYLADREESIEADDRPDAARIRGEVAYLAEIHREVIVKHYLQGEKVHVIADRLGIPKGTVLSRLSGGREQMRKGFEGMDFFEKQSYRPEKLDVWCNGSPGLDGEPWSLVANDLMKQNILIAAYEEPRSVVEIARGLGIPAAYIEKAVESLIEGQLIQRVGNRVFTDFMMTTPEQVLEVLDQQIALSERHYGVIWACIAEALDSLYECAWFGNLSNTERNKCAYYNVLHIFSTGIYRALRTLIPAEEKFPDRPNGGKWVASGLRYSSDFDFEDYRFGQYTYGGLRWVEHRDFLGEKSVGLYIYDTQPDLNKYQRGVVEIDDDQLCRLLYLVKQEIPVQAVAFNPLYLEAIPHMTECGLFKIVDGKPQVNVPVIGMDEYREMDGKRLAFSDQLAEVLVPILRDELPGLQVAVPTHLEKRIVEFRKYFCYAIPMAVIKRAFAEGDFLAGEKDICPPMVLVIEK